MSPAGTNKDTVLTAIRRGLRRGPLPEDQVCALRARLAAHPRHLIPARSRLDHAGQVALFIANVEKEFGSVVRVEDLAEVPGAVADYLAAQNLPGQFVIAPHPGLRAIDWSSARCCASAKAAPRRPMRSAMQHGFAGIAETGT